MTSNDNPQKRPVTAIVSAVVLLSFLVIVLAVLGGDDDGGISGGSASESADPRVSIQSGQTNGIPVDERLGPEPDPVEGTDLAVSVEQAGCELQVDLPIEGNSHIPPTAPTPQYQTNPPTSGDHIVPPLQQADGAYLETPGPENVVHSLEHGRIAIQYSPDLSEEDQLELRGLYDTVYSAALIFPNDELPYDVAVSSWGGYLGCDEYSGQETLDAIRNFGRDRFGKSPEPVEAFGPLSGPTFADPQ